jgi:hypothetical protein
MATIKPFSGGLATPFKLKSDGFISRAMLTENEIRDELLAVYEERLILLYEHYSIDKNLPSRDALLAIYLARQFVPGFQPAASQPKKGRPRVWSPRREAALILEMNWEIKNRKVSARDSATWLAKRGHWKEILKMAKDGGSRAEALRERYARKNTIAVRIATRYENASKSMTKAELSKIIEELIGLGSDTAV